MKKILMATTMVLMAGYATSAGAGEFKLGTSVFTGVQDHLAASCNPVTGAAATPTDNFVITMWGDPGMWVATGLDLMATNALKTKKVDAKKAIKQLKEALGDEQGGSGSGGGDSSTADSSAATVYAPELVMTQLNITKVDGAAAFNNTREAIENFLFESTDKGACTASDRDCAVIRQNEWLLASVTMAAATSDKILSLTANKEKVKNISEKGTTTLIKHFQKLAKEFNGQTTPTGMYNIMAEMVLDTHRQINEANALMGRDLEMQGLRAVRETEITGLKRSGEAEE